MALTGGYFGKAAVELVGIIVHPGRQQDDIGTTLAKAYIAKERPSRLIAYTRNPAAIRLIERVSGKKDILAHTDPSAVAGQIPHASLEADGNLYHIGRYAPTGLYGSFDPSERQYMERPLRERCPLLEDPNNALAISVELAGGAI